MAQPALARDPFRSARLVYRAVCADDESHFKAINDDPIGYLNSKPEPNPECFELRLGNFTNIKLPTASDAKAFLSSVSEQLLGVVICLPPSPPSSPTAPMSPPVPIGQLNLKASPSHAHHHRSTEMAIDILPQYQGKGYGSEAIRWGLNYAFKRAGLHKVRIRAFGWNEGAVRLYERIGFKHEGREREALWHEGRFWDSIEMGMIDREWWEMQNDTESTS